MHKHFVAENTFWRDSSGKTFKVEHVNDSNVYYFNIDTKDHYNCSEAAFINRFSPIVKKRY
jgi:hypothetical protein